MIRRKAIAIVAACIGVAGGGAAAAEEPATLPTVAPLVYAPPGYYGMAWGVPSYGVPRLTSNFASPFGGVGYGNGYGVYTPLPGPYGAELWRPSDPYSSRQWFGGYRTFPIPRNGINPPPDVPVGYYAPSLGPSPIAPH